MLETSVAVKLEHVFDVRIDFHERYVFGPVSGGAKQGYTSVKTGIVDGPRLKGKVLEYSGADWALVRPDGVVELNAHYLLQADDGRLYGTTPNGGQPPSDPNRQGVVYRVTPKGAVTVLHTFTRADGGYPLATVTWGGDGHLYGTTFVGGSNGTGVAYAVL